MRASLPMYDWPQLRPSHDALWTGIRRALAKRGIEGPANLTEAGAGVDFWTAPDLVLSQTCGLPFRSHLHDRVHLVGTPDFGLEACPPGYYRSYFVIRRDDSRQTLAEFADAVFAFNESGSQSGYAAARHHTNLLYTGEHHPTKEQGFWFHTCRQTGAHLASAQAVAQHDADIAAIDAMSWRMIERFEDCAPALRILEATEPTPGLPYITADGLNPETVFAAVRDAIDDLAPEVAADLSLRGIERIPVEEYLNVPTL